MNTERSAKLRGSRRKRSAITKQTSGARVLEFGKKNPALDAVTHPKRLISILYSHSNREILQLEKLSTKLALTFLPRCFSAAHFKPPVLA